jgi:hypothetical protein
MPLLSDGVLATINLQLTGNVSALTLTKTSLGNDAGQSIPLITDGNTTPTVGDDGMIFLPMLSH